MPIIDSSEAEQAVKALLDSLGRSIAPSQECSEIRGDDREFILDQLDEQGFPARFTKIDPSALSHVKMPTLARCKDGRWQLLIRAGWDRVAVQTTSGKVRFISLQNFTESFEGTVLDLLNEFPKGFTLWSGLLRLIWSNRVSVYQVLLLAIFVQGLNLILPQLTGVLVDHVFPVGADDLLRVVVVGMVVVALFQAWFGWIERQTVQRLQTQLDATLSRALYAHIMRLPYRFLEKKSLGQLMQGFEGISQARQLITAEALTALIGGGTALAFLVLMARLMAEPTAAVAGIGALTLALVVLIGKRQAQIQRAVVESQVRTRAAAGEIFTHIVMLKAAGAEQRRTTRWLEMVHYGRELSLQGERLTHGTEIMINLIGQFQTQGLWIWGGLHVLNDSLPLGGLFSFVLMASAFQNAIGKLGSTIVTIWTAMPHLRETQQLLEQQQAPRKSKMAPSRKAADIEIRNLWFRYREDMPWIFSGFDMSIRAGEIRHIKGSSGYGKTTLLKLLAGLYEPIKGEIRIAGLLPQEARHLVAYLPQSLKMFNASILDNMRIFSSGASTSALMKAAERTGLAELVNELPMRYDTLLTLGGDNFSGGQRQLIALTAVIASDRKVLLLDEAMANIDLIRQSQLSRDSIYQDKTIVYSSHQLCEPRH